jgi:hypothetical protein
LNMHVLAKFRVIYWKIFIRFVNTSFCNTNIALDL